MRCISPVFVRSMWMHVPCGKCNWCLSLKRADWSFRIRQEMNEATTSFFLTLTYEDSKLKYGVDPTLCKEDLQLYIKRLREDHRKYSDRSLRYYAVGEYGTVTERPHYHIILFNVHRLVQVQKQWREGFVHIGDVTPASIHYCTKYVINRSSELGGDRAPPFALMSRRPGLGANYLTQEMIDWHRTGQRNFTKVNGQIGRLPRYYKDKLFTSREKERFYQEALLLADVEYQKEIDRLMIHCDFESHELAARYYDSRDWFNHDRVKNKVNALNKF